MEGHHMKDDKKTMVPDGAVITKIPEGVLDITEIDKPEKKKKVNVKKQEQTIKQLEKIIKRKSRGAMIKTASIKEVQKALGSRYVIERDRSYKCRRWIVTSKDKEWFIRFNDPLCIAVDYINKHGAAKFLKEFSLKSKYN
jgi:hypothetical protein